MSPEEYHDDHQNVIKLQLTDQLYVENLEMNKEESKDLFEIMKTNKLLSFENACRIYSPVLGFGSSTSDGSFSQIRIVSQSQASTTLTQETIDKFFSDDSNLPYRPLPPYVRRKPV
jgi:hypothetical protein